MSDEKQIKNLRLEVLGKAQARVMQTMMEIDDQITMVQELGIINQNEWSGQEVVQRTERTVKSLDRVKEIFWSEVKRAENPGDLDAAWQEAQAVVEYLLRTGV